MIVTAQQLLPQFHVQEVWIRLSALRPAILRCVSPLPLVSQMLGLSLLEKSWILVPSRWYVRCEISKLKWCTNVELNKALTADSGSDLST